ncbi:unnamed protein product [Phaedon cochleariae]|uniref:Chitin-binding type-2 domain-containing protein n=1 Tax=Phaedon cochleariae TaxID=80249 RepID=A0A9P0DNI8_PHACE|nr:unnamed protein product [Phaedon cochleariae]
MNVLHAALSVLIFIGIASSERRLAKNIRVTTEIKTGVNFNCPEEFGYYPHPDDCTQYYVCVFGGALLESCTGGLMYSHELQTCDWPRNVGCDGLDMSGSPSFITSTSSKPRQKERDNERERERERVRAEPKPSYPSSQSIQQPSVVVTSRGQPRNLQHSKQDIIKKKQQQQQQQLYEESDETLPPAEEFETDRQQRVYRGQPLTVGQVQRDRDGLRYPNAISSFSGRGDKIGVISFGTHNQQYSVEKTAAAVPARKQIQNGTQYNDNRYEPYYAYYEDDAELYRDDEFPSNEDYNSAQNSQSPSYRGVTTTVTPVKNEIPKRGNTVFIENNYNQPEYYQQSTVADYNDENRYDSQVDDQNTYRSSNRQPYRDDRNELNDVEEVATKRSTTTTTTTTSTSTRTYSTTSRPTITTTLPLRTISYKKSTVLPIRSPSRGRGTAHYSNGGGDQIINNEVTVISNRGTPPPRARPTLKPSTSIISKVQEFVDIYRFPPRRPDPIYPQPQVDKTAAKCRKDVCLLPDCSCGGKEIPGDLPVKQIPQIVLLTFDDSVNDLNKGLYQDLFEKGRTNPNGCPIAASFYVSHEWTDYSQVQNLYSDGHEIASHTVSHSFGEQFSQKKWTKEVAGQREILSAYGGVHLEDVRGLRAPFLSVGGNKMFKMLYDSNFTYDSSMPIYENKPPSWPYTLDYKLFHDCMIPPCPTKSYPGVWEVPMVMWQDLNGGRCSMGDACSNPPDAEGVFKMLTKNFQRHYTTNRAPFGLFYHAAWFTQPHHKQGFINFIDSILAYKDVWFLTNWQAIQWVRDPTPISRLGSFQPFQCDYSDRPKRCNNPKVCNLWHKSGVRYMRTCQPCPDIYPWTGNTGIRSSKIDNAIED